LATTGVFNGNPEGYSAAIRISVAGMQTERHGAADDFKLCLLGRARFLDPSGCPIALPAKAYPLLAILALSSSDRIVGRGRVSELLWPDSSQRGGANLRQLLTRLRHIEERLGVKFLDTGPASLHLNPASVSVDLLELAALLRNGSGDSMSRLCRLYSGDLLEGAEPLFESGREWLDAHRSTLRDGVVGALMRFLDRDEEDDALVALAADRLFRIDPSQEAADRALMRLYARRGQPFQIRRVFESCQSRLRSELGAEPSTETAGLLRVLTSSAMQTVAAAPAGSPPAAALGLAAGVNRRAVPQRDVPGIPKLSVLFPTLPSGSERERSLVTWLLQDVTMGLCSLRSVSVVAPYTSWSLDASDAQRADFEKFGIDYCAQTELTQDRDHSFLYATLINVRTRTIQWAERFPFGRADVAGCHRDLSLRIAFSLASTVENLELARLEADRDASAYHWYLSGQRELRNLDLPSVRRARHAFRNALARCPDYAAAYSGLSRSTHLEWLLLARGDHETLSESISLAERAVALDPEDARGYRELGTSSLYARCFDPSIEAFAQAERKSPQHADMLADFGDALAFCGEPEQGLRKLDQAIWLNPLIPDHYHWYAAGMNYQLGRYDLAIEAIAKMADTTCALRLLAASHAKLGHKQEAQRCVRKAMETYPDFSIDRWIAIVPNRNTDDKRHYADGLRLAGFK
jgi:DNA-binding SARP family transcriptional activator/tetratricopeptide (TPR) repeat protein